MSVEKKRRRISYQSSEDSSSGLSSEQLWFSLNELLRFSLKPLFEFTDFGFDLLMSFMAASVDRRRKVSIHSAEVCRGILLHSFIYKNGEELLETFVQMGIERNLIVDAVMDMVVHKKLACNMVADCPFTEDGLLRHLGQGLEAYFDFRQQVASRFVKLSEHLGKQNAWVKSQNGLISDAGEHVNNYMLAVFRAVDKFYPHRGTLASYVKSWMNNAAGSSLSVFMGEAYVVPRTFRRNITEENSEQTSNFSVPLEKAFEVPDGGILVNQIDNSSAGGILGLYEIPSLHLGLESFGFPLGITPSNLSYVSSSNAVQLGQGILNQILDVDTVTSVLEDINFNQIRRKRNTTDE